MAIYLTVLIGVNFMDITWMSIVKLVLGGLTAYILLPLALMLRELLIWKVICKFLLSTKLRQSISRYSLLVYEWNTEGYAGNNGHNGDTFHINGNEVSPEKYKKFIERENYLSIEINELNEYINSKSRLVSLLLKHFNHSAENPISDWKKQRYEIMERLNSTNKD